jgi:glucokinase
MSHVKSIGNEVNGLKNAILCDLGGTYIRFCLEGEPLTNPSAVVRWQVRKFKGPTPFFTALNEYLNIKGIQPNGRELRLSLPCDVSGDKFVFDNLDIRWAFSRDDIAKAGLGLNDDPLIMNDAVAAFYGMFVMMAEKSGDPAHQYYDVLQSADGADDGRFVMLIPGTGLGAVGAYLEKEAWESDNFFLPIPSEFGSTMAWWGDKALSKIPEFYKNNRGEHNYIMDLLGVDSNKLDLDQFNRREFLVSGLGIIRIYWYLCKTIGDIDPKIKPILDLFSIIKEANSSDLDEDVLDISRHSLELFCMALARSLIDLGLTFTANSAMFLSGTVVNAIGADGLKKFGFSTALSERKSADNYPEKVPIYILSHPYVELVGLDRFISKTKSKKDYKNFTIVS